MTLDPGSIVTFVAEMTTPNLPEIRVWEPDVYKETINAYTLYRGIILGISGLLALFLTILFVVKGTVMFPATAALGLVGPGVSVHRFRFLGHGLQSGWRRQPVGPSLRRSHACRQPAHLSCTPISISTAGTFTIPIWR